MLTPAELNQLHADIVRLRAETMKRLDAPPAPPAIPTPSLREVFWTPLAFATGLIVVYATVTVVLLKLFVL